MCRFMVVVIGTNIFTETRHVASCVRSGIDDISRVSSRLLFQADLVMLCSGEGHKLVWLRCPSLHIRRACFQEAGDGLAVVFEYLQ